MLEADVIIQLETGYHKPHTLSVFGPYFWGSLDCCPSVFVLEVAGAKHINWASLRQHTLLYHLTKGTHIHIRVAHLRRALDVRGGVLLALGLDRESLDLLCVELNLFLDVCRHATSSVDRGDAGWYGHLVRVRPLFGVFVVRVVEIVAAELVHRAVAVRDTLDAHSLPPWHHIHGNEG